MNARRRGDAAATHADRPRTRRRGDAAAGRRDRRPGTGAGTGYNIGVFDSEVAAARAVDDTLRQYMPELLETHANFPDEGMELDDPDDDEYA